MQEPGGGLGEEVRLEVQFLALLRGGLRAEAQARGGGVAEEPFELRELDLADC